MKEWHRTLLLLVLIALAIGYLVWAQHSIDANFTDLLQ